MTIPQKVKVVIVSMFEPANGLPGEMTFYRQHYRELVPVEMKGMGYPQQLLAREDGLLGFIAGVGTVNTAVSLTTLVLGSGLDFSQTYWLISGIAGINPHRGSIGSVGWADWCVDGDLAFEIDAREIPKSWSTGIFPLGAKEPFGAKAQETGILGDGHESFPLNTTLCQWAYQLTRTVELSDTETMATARARYQGFPRAQQSPSVQIGATLSTSRFWHGRLLNEWAERWVEHWTNNKGVFLTTTMEDAGTLHALRHLSGTGKVDFERVLLLRSGSNYSFPPPGINAVESLTGNTDEVNYPAYQPALKNVSRVGQRVVDDLIGNWNHYAEKIPQPPE